MRLPAHPFHTERPLANPANLLGAPGRVIDVGGASEAHTPAPLHRHLQHPGRVALPPRAARPSNSPPKE